jgi:uncharacterized repeat protein (TIGR03843 family)
VPGDERPPEGSAGLTQVVGEPLPATEAAVADALARLDGGSLEVLGYLPRASNETFLARLDDGTLAVYKPIEGETPLWDFPEGTLAAREVAAWELARSLGFPGVPPTVLRDGPDGPGMVQLFIEMDPRGHHYLTMAEERADDFRRVALFDVVANNADRKSGHCLLDVAGRIFVVDHGVCFSPEPKLRTVIWEHAGGSIAPDLLEALRTTLDSLATGPLRARMLELLDPAEVDATVDRADALLSLQRFPHPGPGRPYPWPVV